MSLTQAVKEQARRLGFSLVGVTTPDPPPNLHVYEEWLASGRHGEMEYLATDQARHAWQQNPSHDDAGIADSDYDDTMEWDARGAQLSFYDDIGLDNPIDDTIRDEYDALQSSLLRYPDAPLVNFMYVVSKIKGGVSDNWKPFIGRP